MVLALPNQAIPVSSAVRMPSTIRVSRCAGRSIGVLQVVRGGQCVPACAPTQHIRANRRTYRVSVDMHACASLLHLALCLLWSIQAQTSWLLRTLQGAH